MNDPNLEKLIADSIAQYGLETDAAQTKAEAEETVYQDLMKKATTKALTGIDGRDRIPEALLPYCQVTGGPNRWNTEENIGALRAGWLPSHFIIEAPGLAPIEFALKSTWDTETRKDRPPRVESVVSLHGVNGWETWREAITKAAKMHADNEKWQREQAEAFREQKAMQAGVAPPAISERLESLIRELIREEINQVQTEDF